MPRKHILCVVLVLLAAAGLPALPGLRAVIPAQPPSQPRAEATATADPADPETAIRKLTADYVRAFNAADARAAAELWTEKGEYVGADGEPIRGRAAIEKSLVDFFKSHPKATVDIRVTGIRLLGRQTAMVDGVVKLRDPRRTSLPETQYSALTVLEDGKWRTAAVHEWVPDPGAAGAARFLDWLVGEWTAAGDRGTFTITYAWDRGKSFLYGRYSIVKDGKPVASGTHVLGSNPVGGLRSWSFDSGGSSNTAVWERDGDHWVERAMGTLPDGLEMTAVNVLIPLGPDAFSWQNTERTTDGVPLPASRPVRTTRVKK